MDFRHRCASELLLPGNLGVVRDLRDGLQLISPASQSWRFRGTAPADLFPKWKQKKDQKKILVVPHAHAWHFARVFATDCLPKELPGGRRRPILRRVLHRVSGRRSDVNIVVRDMYCTCCVKFQPAWGSVDEHG